MTEDLNSQKHLIPPMIKKKPSSSKNIMIKVSILFVMLLLMQIPILLIQELADNRGSARQSADQGIIKSWGGKATITVPRIILTKDNYPSYKQSSYLTGLTDLMITTKVVPQELKRGIFNTTVFNAQVNYSLTFSDKVELDTLRKSIENPHMFLFVPIDNFKQKKTPTASMNGRKLILRNDNYSWKLFGKGVLFQIPDYEIKDIENKKIEISMDILGSQELIFNIKNQVTDIEVASTWKSPNFNGDILPISREVGDDGFKATWKVAKKDAPTKFVIELIVPVDYYRLIDRATKYALLFIALTFLAFFIVETVNKWRIHPIQYFLVGAEMVVFYTLLLSLSEHIAFGWSYLIASGATITLISLYTLTILRKSLKSALIIPALLIILYLFLYFILQMQDYALMAGSILLFITIGVAMFSLRNINWYNEEK